MKLSTPWTFACLMAASIALVSARLDAAEAPVILPPPVQDAPKVSGPPQIAVLAGGCFWGVQGVFEHVRGVRRVLAGYAGGAKATADYESVSTGSTGHAESVQIAYDPAVLSYGQILQIAFSVVHDPTQPNRQGPDRGSQYRSAIFYADSNQKKIAETYIAQLDAAHVFPHPIATRLESLKGFYPAESYHQDFAERNPSHPYIAYYDLPKIQDFRNTFPDLYLSKPVLANQN
jgi:peptide-methionine (S)-S-oxide reductase